MNKKILAIAVAIMVVGNLSVTLIVRSTQSGAVGGKTVLGKYRFRVEIDGITVANFREVEGLNVTVGVIEYRDGSDVTMAPTLIPGLVSYGPLILRFGVTSGTELWEWMEEVLDGDMDSARRFMSVIIQDLEGNDVVRYNLSNVWPSSFRVGKLDSLGPSVAIEELVIEYEGLERESYNGSIDG